MNIISIKDFYKLKDIDKKTLIEDIFYCKQEHDNKPNSKGINTNFCVHLDRANVLEKMYDKILETTRRIFTKVELADNNSKKCWSLCTNKNYWESVPHNHINTSTVNSVFYLQVPQINGEFCGKIKFLSDNKWIEYQPMPNELLIFPNDLIHDTTYHDTEDWRISLNFEIITNHKVSILNMTDKYLLEIINN